jgi:hypothetical protein
MQTVDVDAMEPHQRAAWRRFWRELLSPDGNEDARAGGDLAEDTDADDVEATDKTATGRNGNGSERRNVQ